MKYSSVQFELTPHSSSNVDILSAFLDLQGFEGIVEENSSVVAYIPHNELSGERLNFIVERMKEMGCDVRYTTETVPEQNWNSLWESNFEPVRVDNRLLVRAPFHQPDPSAGTEIVIEPKMSFGTGHHHTTKLMLTRLLGQKMTGLQVMDMGCGTGVLAILAALRGAQEVVAIDNDKWAFENTQENVTRNHVPDIRVIHGGKEAIPDQEFDIILANINRNILLDQVHAYLTHLKHEGQLWISGIMGSDRQIMETSFSTVGLELHEVHESGEWLMMIFLRK